MRDIRQCRCGAIYFLSDVPETMENNTIVACDCGRHYEVHMVNRSVPYAPQYECFDIIPSGHDDEMIPYGKLNTILTNSTSRQLLYLENNFNQLKLDGSVKVYGKDEYELFKQFLEYVRFVYVLKEESHADDFGTVTNYWVFKLPKRDKLIGNMSKVKLSPLGIKYVKSKTKNPILVGTYVIGEVIGTCLGYFKVKLNGIHWDPHGTTSLNTDEWELDIKYIENLDQ